MTEPSLIGCHITATAPRRRALRGVVLPPAARSRTGALRLAVDGRPEPVRFDPADWTVTVIAGPLYRFGNLAAEHLATRTMLRTERRREPARGQRAIAEYQLHKGRADLYAVADTTPLADLSPARAEAWARARTCADCAKTPARPLPKYEGVRRCWPCQMAAALARWTEQSRAAQADVAAWARAVLADPAAVLITRDQAWEVAHVRAETIAGTVLVDARTRGHQDIVNGWYQDTPELLAARREKYADTLGPDDLAPVMAALAASRLIGWYRQDIPSGYGYWAGGRIDPADIVSERLSLWSGVVPNVLGTWHPEPKMPWNRVPPTFLPYSTHRDLHRKNDDLAAELRNLRALIQMMADQQPPEPTIYRPEPVRIDTRR